MGAAGCFGCGRLRFSGLSVAVAGSGFAATAAGIGSGAAAGFGAGVDGLVAATPGFRAGFGPGRVASGPAAGVGAGRWERRAVRRHMSRPAPPRTTIASATNGSGLLPPPSSPPEVRS